MANIRPEKQAAVAGLKEQLSSAKGAVLTGYRGLTVAQDMKLRAKLREAGVTYHVVKNTMVRIAANEIGLEGLDPVLNGTTALAVSADDAVAPAKVIYEFIKENKLENTEVLTIKAGLVEGKVINVEEVKALDCLYSKWESFGFNVIPCDGHNIEMLIDSFEKARQTKGQPSIIIARTVKGKGVPFMENKAEWHGKAPHDEQYERAMKALKLEEEKIKHNISELPGKEDTIWF